MKSILNTHPFFPTSLPPHQCPWMLMVSHHHLDALFCTVFSLFLPFFLEKLYELFMCIYQRMVQNTFLACKLIVHILSPEHDHF